MQRQAVPISQSKKFIVGTRLEGQSALDSGALAIAKHEGKIFYTDTDKILLSRSDAPRRGEAMALSGGDKGVILLFQMRSTTLGPAEEGGQQRSMCEDGSDGGSELFRPKEPFSGGGTRIPGKIGFS
ncbi:hypothetical protein L1987_06981 [Smallanthus sonchifolius]|uniref:Uncharacterized protein n=1 Tax=Smallanthus sonchifolius TaxID=185202 RepID=A0ACB9JZT4_9ASTR|nr:hypothetical protein L1987_06981 [Smallanthus sonchifolius]